MTTRARKLATRPTIAILSQVYVPDPAAVGQYMHDVARELVQRGFSVVAFTSDRGYDDPGICYPRHECIDGVEIHRLPLTSFGKNSIAVRIAAGASFVAQATARAALRGEVSCVLLSTTPPLAPLAGIGLDLLRRAPLVFWAMDINPDQMIATGRLSPTSMVARGFDVAMATLLRRSSAVVALDRFMAGALQRKASIGERLHVIAPWPLSDAARSIPHADNPFRHQVAPPGARIVMYSGNVGLANPITTILEAFAVLRDDDRLRLVVVGGGQGRLDVERFVAEKQMNNVTLLPYQPLDQLAQTLSAADVHLVSVGESQPGVSHSCKIYGALAVGRPILYLGPEGSHADDIVRQAEVGWSVRPGNVEQAMSVLRDIRDSPDLQLVELGKTAAQVAERDYRRADLLQRFCSIVEAVSGTRHDLLRRGSLR